MIGTTAPEFLSQHIKPLAPVTFETAIAVVFLQRYKNGNEHGVHLIGNPPKEGWSTRFPFVTSTVGLFGHDKTVEIATYVYFGLNLSSHTVLEIDDELAHYIGDQIIPLEWKTEYRDGSPTVLDYIEVFK